MTKLFFCSLSFSCIKFKYLSSILFHAYPHKISFIIDLLIFKLFVYFLDRWIALNIWMSFDKYCVGVLLLHQIALHFYATAPFFFGVRSIFFGKSIDLHRYNYYYAFLQLLRIYIWNNHKNHCNTIIVIVISSSLLLFNTIINMIKKVTWLFLDSGVGI